MENKSSNGWKFFALLFGALLAGVVGLYIYKQQNPDYDPWEEPWENSFAGRPGPDQGRRAGGRRHCRRSCR